MGGARRGAAEFCRVRPDKGGEGDRSKSKTEGMRKSGSPGQPAEREESASEGVWREREGEMGRRSSPLPSSLSLTLFAGHPSPLLPLSLRGVPLSDPIASAPSPSLPLPPGSFPARRWILPPLPSPSCPSLLLHLRPPGQRRPARTVGSARFVHTHSRRVLSLTLASCPQARCINFVKGACQLCREKGTVCEMAPNLAKDRAAASRA